MEKVKLTIEEAQNCVFELLKITDLGNRVYELAQSIFQKYINLIEDGAEINGVEEYLDQDQEWYDEIREDFYQAVYDKITEFLTQKKVKDYGMGNN